MKFNQINPSENYELNSSNSKDYELKSVTLDQLYKKQLTELRELLFRKAHPSDIEICRKWLKVFNRISKPEKMARNCLCTLMQEQIKESSCLQEPFINLQNCNRNLECILRELDDQASNDYFPAGSDATYKSHVTGTTLNPQQDINMIFQEKHNIDLKTETSEVIRELHYLSLQLTEKQIENIKLKEIAEKCRAERESFEEILENMKKSVLGNIKDILLDMKQCGMIKTQFKFFQNIFADFSNDKEFVNIVSKYDLDLQHILHKQFECEFNKQKSIIARHICRKFFKSKTKLREKFEHRLAVQNESHKLELKLAKLNSFSILRQIFINFHNEFGKLEGWEILKALEDKYQTIVNSSPK